MKTHKDPLEELVEKNKEAFDQYEPSEGLWEKIDQRVHPKQEKTVPLKWVLRVAAVLVVAVGVALAFWRKEETEIPVEIVQEVITLEDISPDLAEADSYYSMEINHRMEELESMGIDQEIMEEIAMLDEEYQQLLAEAEGNLNNEKVIEALIQNYRLKLEILEDVLEEIKHQESDENHNTSNDEIEA